MTFQVGDKVRVVKDDTGLLGIVGITGTIIDYELRNEQYLVELKFGYKLWFSPNELEKIS